MSDFADFPTGYVDSPKAREVQLDAFAAAGVDLTTRTVAGEFQRLVSQGVSYLNLHDAEADFIRGAGAGLVRSLRNITPCGILEPFGQQTGICNGCSHSTGAWLSWCNRFVASGDCPEPREVTFLGGYLLGRELTMLSRGDSGAFPSYTIAGFHDFGVLPVDCGGKFNLRALPPHGPTSQESLCVQMRDRPGLYPEWLAAMHPLKTRVFQPTNEASVLDCLASRYAVTFGSSYQARESSRANPVSALYMLTDGWGRPTGHETCGSGFFVYRGRAGLLKTESWWNANQYPGGDHHEKRVVIQTDSGPRQLYRGQCAIWADEWMRSRPESWAVGWPGSAA